MMGKRIYLLQNAEDFKKFANHLYSLNIRFCEERSGEQLQLDKIEEEIFGKNYSIVTMEGQAFCEYSTCLKIGKFINPGCIALECNYSKWDSKSIFKTLYDKILKFIKQNYILSDAKTEYVGKSFFKDWWEFKVSVIDSIKVSAIKFGNDESDLQNLFDYLESLGYNIESQENDIRDNIRLNYNASIFFIYRDADKAVAQIRARKRFFSVDSEGCFLYKAREFNRKYNKIQFDARFLDGRHSDVIKLYKDIILFMKNEYELNNEGVYV